MKKAALLAMLVVLFIVVVRSNHAQQIRPSAVVLTSAIVPSFFPPALASQTVSETSGQEVTAPVREFAESAKPDLLSAIAAALDHDKKKFCQDSQSPNCDKDFVQAFDFRKVTLTKSGQVGFIVEFSGADFCGSAGCTINVLKQTGDKFERTIENDEVGSLDSFEFATTTTNGFYDLKKHGKDGTDYYYAWTGSSYQDVEAPLSAEEARAASAYEPAQKECQDCVTVRPVGVPSSRGPAAIR